MKDKIKDIFTFLLYFGGSVIVGSIIALIIYGVIYLINYINIEHITSPVEDETHRIDSIIRENNTTKIIIERINNDKHETIIKVRNLDNDSTLKLFYELVKE